MPWPNRVRDGRYTVRGTAYQLPLTEVERANASHGLVRWALWELVRHEPDLVEVRYRLHPQPGWPWHLDLGLVYHLTDDGLVVTASAINPGGERVPFGFGGHPYVATGGVDPAQISVTIPARTYLVVDGERLLPQRVAAVGGTPEDLRAGPRLGDLALDTAYTDLERGDDGAGPSRWAASRRGQLTSGGMRGWGGCRCSRRRRGYRSTGPTSPASPSNR